MTTEVVVPTLGESVTEATVATWLKNTGDIVALDEPIVELETDKVTLEVNSPVAGTMGPINYNIGESVDVGTILCVIKQEGIESSTVPGENSSSSGVKKEISRNVPSATLDPQRVLSPAVRKLVEENDLDLTKIIGTGKDGRLVKGDLLAALNAGENETPTKARDTSTTTPSEVQRIEHPKEERVKMSRLRQAIASRLKDAQNTAAMLTTYNEVDMSAVMALRTEYRDLFEEKYGVRLGIMSFFVKACVEALRDFPAVNAEISGDEIIFKNYYDIGVAVGTPRGLVVPVLRDADKNDFSEIEKSINDFGIRAREGKLTLEEISGGTFTISNGGVYGSLMSSPILNPPQSGILGMHKTQNRPVAVHGNVEIRPMMYLALSYDHRIVDGREAVTFLVRVKNAIEDPRRLVLGL